MLINAFYGQQKYAILKECPNKLAYFLLINVSMCYIECENSKNSDLYTGKRTFCYNFAHRNINIKQ